jgi:hypothetical protein
MLQASMPQTLHYWNGLEIVIVAGGLGGLVSAIGALVEGGKENGEYAAARGVPLRFFIFGRLAVGVGGAAAVILAALSVNKFTGSSDIDLLAVTTLCFVAGSIGYRLLPMVAAQLEKRLGDIEKKTEQVEKKTEQVEKKTEQVQKKTELVEKKAEQANQTARQGSDLTAVTSNVVTALQVLDRQEEISAVVDQTIVQLQTLTQQFPQERTPHIVLARLYAEKRRDFDNAIAVLRRFVAAKGTQKDKDVADAEFNIACYISLKLAEETEEKKRSELENEGVEALAESLRIIPGNLNDAKNDNDLTALRETTAGRKLLFSEG